MKNDNILLIFIITFIKIIFVSHNLFKKNFKINKKKKNIRNIFKSFSLYFSYLKT